MIKKENGLISAFQEKYRFMSKEEVIEQYIQDYDLFLKTLRRVPIFQHDKKLTDGWGVKQIAVHIASWNLETINGIQIVVCGGIPWFFDDDDKINEFNAKVVERKKGATLQNNLQQTERTHRRLINYLEEFSNTLFHQSFGRTWNEQEVTPSLVCSYRHYLHHVQDIARWLEQTQNES